MLSLPVPSVLFSVKSQEAKDFPIPLSQSAQQVIAKLEKYSSEWLFPGHKRSSHISNNAMLALLRKRMGISSITVHGFRSTFRDWAAEKTNTQNHVVEMALAHGMPNKTEAAYRRMLLIPKRIELMEEWAGYCRWRYRLELRAGDTREHRKKSRG